LLKIYKGYLKIIKNPETEAKFLEDNDWLNQAGYLKLSKERAEKKAERLAERQEKIRLQEQGGQKPQEGSPAKKDRPQGNTEEKTKSPVKEKKKEGGKDKEKKAKKSVPDEYVKVGDDAKKGKKDRKHEYV